MLTKTAALEILNDLTNINVNVVLVAIADPTYMGQLDDDEVRYTIELNRNTNLTSEHLVEIDKVLEAHDCKVEMPGMLVLTNEKLAERAEQSRNQYVLPPQETPPAEHGGGTEENLGKTEEPA